MTDLRVLVIGGTGFLGRRIVRALVKANRQVVVASRHPNGGPAERSVRADVTDKSSISHAVRGMDAVVNCVSLYVETGDTTFEDIHVEGARNVAEAAREAGVETLVHISGIGSDASSSSDYIRARGRGEDAVHQAFPEATILRPSVMFGPGDAFLTAISDVAAKSPVFPLFGGGQMRLQPVFADDVADAVSAALSSPSRSDTVYELGGPDVLSYRTIVEKVLTWSGRRRLLVPFPLAGWTAAAHLSKVLPSPPITPGQVALMRHDNVVTGGTPGFAELGIEPQSILDVAPSCLGKTELSQSDANAAMP